MYSRQISNELWDKMVPLIPEHKTHRPLGTHHKRVDNRTAMNVIFFVLRTGCQWNALNGEWTVSVHQIQPIVAFSNGVMLVFLSGSGKTDCWPVKS